MADNHQVPQGASGGRHAKSEDGSNFAPPRPGSAPMRPSATRVPASRPKPRTARTAQGSYPVPSRAKSDRAQNAPQPGAARYGSEIAGKKKKGGPWRVVFWVALVVFLAAVVALGVIAFSYWQGQDKYDNVATEVFAPPADIDQANLADVTVDWDALSAINPETVGWIYVPDTSVNYPIVHTTDDEKYLTTDFLGEKNWLASYGSIFLSAANTPNFSDPNNIVYGHHMNDGTMFAKFAAFRDEATFNAHRTIYIFTPEANYRLTTFSLMVVEASDPLAQTTFTDAAQMQSYVQDKIERSTVTPNPAVGAVDDMTKLFAFVTCSDYTQTNERIVLFASVTATEPLGGANADPATTEDVVSPEDAAAAADAAKEIV